MTPSEILRGAAELLSKPVAWCQRAFARVEPHMQAPPLPREHLRGVASAVRKRLLSRALST